MIRENLCLKMGGWHGIIMADELGVISEVNIADNTRVSGPLTWAMM